MNFKMIYRLSVERKKFLVIFIRGMIKCPRKGLKCKIKEPLKNEWFGEQLSYCASENEDCIKHITRIYAEKIY